MIKHIIFDLDGTLINSLDIYKKIGNELAEKFGYKMFDDNRIKELLALPIRKRIENLGISIFKLPRLGMEVIQAFKTYASQIEPVEGVRGMLEDLNNKGYAMSIVSSNSVGNIKTFLEANGIEAFTNIETSKGLFGKNITIEKLIHKLNVKKDEVIYIGDEERDIDACKKVGIKIISVLWGFDSRELLQKADPDYIVSNPGQIVDIIEGIK